MDFRYILIGGMSLTALLFFVTLMFSRKKVTNFNLGQKHRTLLLFVFSGLFFNFFASYFIGDPTQLMAKMWRPPVEPYAWDMGPTSLGWILYLFKSFHSGADSWWAMSEAFDYLKDNPYGMVYQETLFNKGIKFQYPTTSLLLLDFIRAQAPIVTWQTIYDALNLFSIYLIPILAFIQYKLYYKNIEDGYAENLPDFDRFTGYFLAMSSILIFYPLVFSVYLGQIQTGILLLTALAFLSFSKKQYMLTGILFGVCICIKPQWVLIVLWACIRKQWSMVLGAITVAIVFCLISIYLYGLNNFFDYLNILSFLSKHGESYYINQSINGLINRSLHNGINNEFIFNSIPPYNPLVHYATLVFNFSIIVFVMAWRRRSTPNLVDLSIVVLGLTLASPIAWNHHYTVLIPIFAVITPIVLSKNIFGKWSLPTMIILWLLTSQNYEAFTNQLSDTGWNFLQSTLFFGALMLFLVLVKITKHLRPR